MDWPITVSIIFICMMTTTNTQAQNSAQDFVDAHNGARSEVGVPPLIWDETVAAYAQSYADRRSADCAMQHSHGGPYGENLAAGSWDLSANESVGMWVDEKKFYDVDSNACVGGGEWGITRRSCGGIRAGLAAGRARCLDGWTFVTCNYDPPGNYIGERPF
ncbi:hypothetical protein ABFS82_14G101500 [Erythranthe guttata]